MKSNRKTKTIIFIISGIFFVLSSIFTTSFINITINSNISSEFSDETISDKKNLKITAPLGKIHIDNNSGWLDFRNDGNCTGNGTYSKPYLIEDLIIDGGGSGSCILIENSDVFFKIENCTVYNGDSGIVLSNVNNSQLINNTCSFSYSGISLDNSHKNTILENTVNNNTGNGISSAYSDDNTISGNVANNNSWGMWVLDSNNNTISENTVNYNSWGMWVLDSNNNTISGNIANNNTFHGLLLLNSNYTMVSGNTANNNRFGIYLYESDYNIISGNILLGNDRCIEEINCRGNKISDNGSCTYGQGDEIILGYNLLFLLGILSIVIILISNKLKKS